jgi:hypothetical protein
MGTSLIAPGLSRHSFEARAATRCKLAGKGWQPFTAWALVGAPKHRLVHPVP